MLQHKRLYSDTLQFFNIPLVAKAEPCKHLVTVIVFLYVFVSVKFNPAAF